METAKQLNSEQEKAFVDKLYNSDCPDCRKAWTLIIGHNKELRKAVEHVNELKESLQRQVTK